MIQAAFFTPYRIGSVWQPPARSPSMSAKSLVVDAPSTKSPKIAPMNHGSGSKIVFTVDQPATLSSMPRGIAIVMLAHRPWRFVRKRRRRVGPDQHAREEDDPEALAVRLEPHGRREPGEQPRERACTRP